MSKNNHLSSLEVKRGMQVVRDRLANTGLYALAVLLPITVVIALSRIFEHGWHFTHLINILLAIFVVIIAIFVKKLPFTVRAGILLGITLFAGTFSILIFGLAGVGKLALAAFCILTAVLFGIQAGTIALSGCLLFLVGTGIAVQLDWLTFNFDTSTYLSSLTTWATSIVGFALFLTLAIIGSGSIYRHLENSFETLAGRTIELSMANQELEEEVSERKKVEAIQLVLLEISRASNLSNSLEELLVKIRTLLSQVLDTTNFFVALYDQNRDEYSFPYMADQHDSSRVFTREELKKSLTDYVRRTGAPLLLDEEALRELEEKGEVDMVGTPSHSWLGVPLRTPRSIIGVVAVQSYRESYHFSKSDLAILDHASGHIALAIERKKTEDALRESEQRFRRIFEEGPLGMAIMDLNFRFYRVNHVLCRMLGYSEKELIQLDLIRISHSEEAVSNLEIFERLVKKELMSYKSEKRLLHKDSHEIWTDFSATVVLDEKEMPLHILGMFEDITERKIAEAEKQHLENQFRQAQKMQAVGLLAGGVAHDFNNILTGIGWTSELAISESDPSNPALPAFRQIQELADRAAVLTRQLLTFSRQQPLNPVSVDLNSLIENTMKMLERLIGEDISLSFEGHAENDKVKADPGQIEQVLMNLAINARDAMPKGGKLSIKTRNDYALNPKIEDLEGEDSEPIVVIEVRDTGNGMDEDTIDRIFEPFFTTKEVGKGTGLGLSIAYGIVRQHGGHISAESEVGNGSVFTISLPSFKLRDQDTKLPPEADMGMILGGSEKILVVEDEESLRNLIQRILEGHGYKVSVASGPQGVDEKVIDGIDLLLSDIVMPDGNGIDLFKRLRKIKPQLKVVLMSGYTDKPAISERKEVPFLQKPFSPRDLANTIRTVLDSRKKS